MHFPNLPSPPTGGELRWVQDAFEKNWITTAGENLNECEKTVAEKVGCKYLDQTDLPEEHREILKSRKRCVTGKVVIERHLKKVSIYIDRR